MAKQKTIKAKGSNIHITFAGEDVLNAFRDLCVEELQTVADGMANTARELCPVSKKERLTPITSRPQKSLSTSRNMSKLGKKAKRSRIAVRDYQNVKTRTIGRKWESRTPGRLRSSIRSSVSVRNDGSAILLFLEAGNEDAFYAPFVELGTYKMNPHPFLRPAFNQHTQAFNRAVLRAFERLGSIT